MSDEVLQFIIVMGFGALCFGCGCLTAFIVTRTKFRNEMIKRDVVRYNQQTQYSISILPLVHVSPRSFITNARRIYAGPAQRQQNGYNSEDLKTGRE